MRTNRTWWSAGAALVMALSLLAGCSSGAGDKKGEAKPAESASGAAAAADKKPTLKVLAGYAPGIDPSKD
ncbi:MAG: hypothetical protein K6T85_06105, partial [Gorillibacterium sp.]|nr:hypothetical protein [Gorillibacterium sp.]